MFKKIRFRYIFILYAIILSACVFNIYPTHDDFYYSAPHKVENLLKNILPTQVFWRPLEIIYSHALNFMPSLFPDLNRIILLAGHLFLCAALFSALKKFTKKSTSVFIGVSFFCLSPGIVGTVSESDFINQILAMSSGIISLMCFFRASQMHDLKYYILWFMLAFLSVLFKENGIAWFVAPVMIYIVYCCSVNGMKFLTAVQQNMLFIIIGFVGMALYFAVRFSLTGGAAFNIGHAVISTKADRYVINFSVLNILKNYCTMLGGAVTSIDPLAFFLKPRNFPLLIATAVISIIFLCYVLSLVIKIFRSNKKLFYILAWLLLCMLFIRFMKWFSVLLSFWE